MDGDQSAAYQRLAVESIEQAEQETDPGRRNKLFQMAVWWTLFGKADSADLDVRLN
jgi:hypothetical protein